MSIILCEYRKLGGKQSKVQKTMEQAQILHDEAANHWAGAEEKHIQQAIRSAIQNQPTKVP